MFGALGLGLVGSAVPGVGRSRARWGNGRAATGASSPPQASRPVRWKCSCVRWMATVRSPRRCWSTGAPVGSAAGRCPSTASAVRCSWAGRRTARARSCRCAQPGGLHDPRQHELGERLIAQGVEPQPVVAGAQHLPQHGVGLAGDDRGPGRFPGAGTGQARQRELALPGVELAAGHRHQRRQLGLVVGGAHVLQHHIPAAAALGDLDLRRPRPARGLPHEHHRPGPYAQRGVSLHPAAGPRPSVNPCAQGRDPHEVARVRSKAATATGMARSRHWWRACEGIDVPGAQSSPFNPGPIGLSEAPGKVAATSSWL